jgi:hypothetical protein
MTPPTAPTLSDAASLQGARAGNREAFIALAEQHPRATIEVLRGEARQALTAHGHIGALLRYAI